MISSGDPYQDVNKPDDANSDHESTVQSGKASLKRWQLSWRRRFALQRAEGGTEKSLREEELQGFWELADRAWGEFLELSFKKQPGRSWDFILE